MYFSMSLHAEFLFLSLVLHKDGCHLKKQNFMVKRKATSRYLTAGAYRYVPSNLSVIEGVFKH